MITAGPWKAEDGHIYGMDGATHVGWVEPATVDAEANANLIAAAPDLLAALREFIADVDAVGLDYAETEWNDLLPTYHHAVAAIAKAEGKVQ